MTKKSKLYKNADVVVSAGNADALNISMIEAFTYKTPFVSYDVKYGPKKTLLKMVKMVI
ncbi:hypothetical protein [Apilactobacillus ozensis]|uniref:hypothetical protein n=1 Tax=Apilactobacillus ozensis TaxID=866801 RepID=UPI0034E1DC08